MNLSEHLCAVAIMAVLASLLCCAASRCYVRMERKIVLIWAVHQNRIEAAADNGMVADVDIKWFNR